MNKPSFPYQYRPYFPHTNHGHMSERKITHACNWWKSHRTLKHLAKATTVLMNHVLYENQPRAAVVRARVYIDRFDTVVRHVGLPTV